MNKSLIKKMTIIIISIKVKILNNKKAKKIKKILIKTVIFSLLTDKMQLVNN